MLKVISPSLEDEWMIVLIKDEIFKSKLSFTSFMEEYMRNLDQVRKKSLFSEELDSSSLLSSGYPCL